MRLELVDLTLFSYGTCHDDVVSPSSIKLKPIVELDLQSLKNRLSRLHSRFVLLADSHILPPEMLIDSIGQAHTDCTSGYQFLTRILHERHVPQIIPFHLYHQGTILPRLWRISQILCSWEAEEWARSSAQIQSDIQSCLSFATSCVLMQSRFRANKSLGRFSSLPSKLYRFLKQGAESSAKHCPGDLRRLCSVS